MHRDSNAIRTVLGLRPPAGDQDGKKSAGPPTLKVARGGSRTHKRLPSEDFNSPASLKEYPDFGIHYDLYRNKHHIGGQKEIGMSEEED